MKTIRQKRILYYVLFILVICLLSVGAGVFFHEQYVANKKRDADNLLDYYKETLLLKMDQNMQISRELANTVLDSPGNLEPFYTRAIDMLQKEEVVSILLFENETVIASLTPSSKDGEVGKTLDDYPYIFPMGKATNSSVIEGPITIHDTKNEVFLYIYPLLEGDIYRGEVAVALSNDYVQSQMNLKYLHEKGYEYELWRINPQNGRKEFISVSDEALDFSDASKTTFYLPTQWALSILPSEGWVTPFGYAMLIMSCLLLIGILLVLFFALNRVYHLQSEKKQAFLLDSETGLRNRIGFCRALDQWINHTPPPHFVLYYFDIQNYNYLSQAAEGEMVKGYLTSISSTIKEYVKSEYLAGRVGESNFVLAVKEDMTDIQKADFAKGFSLKLIWKVQIGGSKVFTRPRYHYLTYSGEKRSAEQLLQEVTRADNTPLLKDE